MGDCCTLKLSSKHIVVLCSVAIITSFISQPFILGAMCFQKEKAGVLPIKITKPSKRIRCFFWFLILIFGLLRFWNQFWFIHDTLTNISSVKLMPDGKNISNIKLIPDGKIRLLFGRGCSGSSAAYRTAREMLKAHGYEVYEGKSELFRPEKNIIIPRDELLAIQGYDSKKRREAIMFNVLKLNKEVFKSGKILIVKAPPEFYTDVQQYMGENISMAAMFRANSLDRIVCQVRDCFREDLGYPVIDHNNGTFTKTDLCFKRRRKSVKVKAQINTKVLVQAMREEKKGNKNLPAQSWTQSYEDLFEYAYTSEDEFFQSSVDAWASLLEFFFEVDKIVIARVLRPTQNTRSQRSLDDTISNVKEVVDTLREAGMDILS